MLDLSQIATDIKNMVERLKSNTASKNSQLSQALNLLLDRNTNFAQLQNKTFESQKTTSFLIAGLNEPPYNNYLPPQPPKNYCVMATDGSQIETDRHQSISCYVINIGQVRLDYGNSASATLTSTPTLYFDDASKVISNGYLEQPIDPTLFSVKRLIEECNHLVTMSSDSSLDLPTLALLDGSLILWNLSGREYPPFVVEELLEKAFLCNLESLKQISHQKPLVFASYISFPHSSEVVNALRLLLCPHSISNCDRYCKDILIGKRPCDALTGLLDRDLFIHTLNNHERSALFSSQSKIIREKYGEHSVYFFYIKLDNEIARVEVPQWVARDRNKLDMTHALILEQCISGNGYPVALSEAHEQAIISSADKENFQHLISSWLSNEGIDNTNSAKSKSKKNKWI